MKPVETRAMRIARELKAGRTGTIWKVGEVLVCPSDVAGAALYEIWLRRDGQLDLIVVYSMSGTVPREGFTIERIPEPMGGEAVIWNYNGRPGYDYVGSGYTEEALPYPLVRPPRPIGMTEKQKRMFGVIRGDRS